MGQIIQIGMDTSKYFFQLEGERRRGLRRLPPLGAAAEFGHEAKLIAPQLVKPCVKRGMDADGVVHLGEVSCLIRQRR